MYAIVEISGKQFKVEKKQKQFINRIEAEEGKKVSIENEFMLNPDHPLIRFSESVSKIMFETFWSRFQNPDLRIRFRVDSFA